MATPLVIPNCAIITLHWSGPTRTWVNVLGARATGAMPVIDQAFANTLHTFTVSTLTGAAVLTHLATTTIFENLSVRSINAANLPEFTSTGTPAAGAGAGDSLPLSVAACVTLRTALAGKSFRGRVYFSGFDEGENDATGRMSAAASSSVANFMTNWSAGLSAQGMVGAVLSRPFGGRTIPAKVQAARPGQGNPITAAVSRNLKWESQRRRTGRT